MWEDSLNGMRYKHFSLGEPAIKNSDLLGSSQHIDKQCGEYSHTQHFSIVRGNIPLFGSVRSKMIQISLKIILKNYMDVEYTVGSTVWALLACDDKLYPTLSCTIAVYAWFYMDKKAYNIRQPLEHLCVFALHLSVHYSSSCQSCWSYRCNLYLYKSCDFPRCNLQL